MAGERARAHVLVRELTIASARLQKMSSDFEHIAQALLGMFPTGRLAPTDKGLGPASPARLVSEDDHADDPEGHQ